MKYPAVRIQGQVYVSPTETLTHPHTRQRILARSPVRHADHLTYAISIIAAQSRMPDYVAKRLIKQIDMGRVVVEFGHAEPDGSRFVLDIAT